MSSSFRLKKRREALETWSFGPDADHYIRPWAECHPDYTAIPIGNPDGVKVCVRNRSSAPPPSPLPPRKYHKFASRPYDPGRKSPVHMTRLDQSPAVQLYNPDRYVDRRAPGQSYNLAHDYLRPEVKYDGTGVFPNRTPSRDGTRFFEFGIEEVRDPPVFDITRLQQMRPMWEEARVYHWPQTHPHSKMPAYAR